MFTRLFQIGTILIFVSGCKSFKVDGTLGQSSNSTPPPPPALVFPSIEITTPIPTTSTLRSARLPFVVTPGTHPIESTRCQLDDFPQFDCDNLFSVGSLSEGSHSITVSSVDVEGNRSTEVIDWNVYLTPPSIQWTTNPLPSTLNNTTDPAPSIALNFTAVNSLNNQCALNGINPIGCINSLNYAMFPQGLNFVTVRASGAGGISSQRSLPFFLKPMIARTVTVAACQEINMPGLYNITQDLVGDSAATGAPCIDIHDTVNVVLDCGGRSITAWNAIKVTDVNNFTIQNCTIRATGQPAGTGQIGNPMLGVPTAQGTILITDSSQGNLDNLTVGEMTSDVNYAIRLQNALNTVIHNSRIDAMVHLSYSSNNQIYNNQINCPRVSGSTQPGRCDGLVVLGVLSNSNRVLENTIDGKAISLLSQTATKDGIIVFETEGNMISRNTISNATDSGIQTYGTNKTMTVFDNQITRTGAAGISGKWWMSLSGSLFARNRVQQTPNLFSFRRSCGLRTGATDALNLLTADTQIVFQDNKFEHNSISNPSNGTVGAFEIFDATVFDVSAACGAVTTATASDFVTSGNSFINNIFPTALSTNFGPPSATNVIDLGGNTCMASTTLNNPVFCWDSSNSSGISQ